jgi:hypothetical protein
MWTWLVERTGISEEADEEANGSTTVFPKAGMPPTYLRTTFFLAVSGDHFEAPGALQVTIKFDEVQLESTTHEKRISGRNSLGRNELTGSNFCIA